MTTLDKVKIKCSICGKLSQQIMLMSASSYGSPDLDGRPPELMRSTVGTWIQTCPRCGYCSPSVSTVNNPAAKLVYSKAYRQILNNTDLPKLANAFCCHSLLKQKAGDYLAAGWACIHAAWICDDKGCSNGAKKCRRRAVMLLEKATEIGQTLFEDAGEEELLISDLLRRSGRLTAALKKCEEGLANPEAELRILTILSAEKELILKHDAECGTVPSIPNNDSDDYPFFDKRIFDCIEMIAKLEHKSKIETRHLLTQTAIKGYVDQKDTPEKSIKDMLLLSDRTLSHEGESASIKLIAHLEHKRKSEVTRFLLEEGIKSYAKIFKELAANKGLKGRQVSDVISRINKSLSNQAQPAV